MPTCAFNEYFNSVTLWESLGTGTLTSVGGRLHMDIEDGGDYSHTGLYQYKIGSGDFDFRIDFSDYSADDSTNGLIVKLQVLGMQYSYTDMAEIEYQLIMGGLLHSVKGKFIVNNVEDEDIPEYPGSRPTMLRVKRISNRITTYYYSGGAWYLLYSKDFGARASNLTSILIKVEDSNTHGGYAEFDNLIFYEGCPTAYPKAWTTTTSTVSTSSSSSSTASTTSTLSTTSSTLSTTTTTV